MLQAGRLTCFGDEIDILFICLATVIMQSMLLVMTENIKLLLILNYHFASGYLKDTLAIK